MSINFYGAVSLTRELLRKRKLKAGASIVFITSISADVATVGHGAYCASKAALEAYAKVLALETAGQRIRVNCIQPGMVVSNMQQDAARKIDDSQMSAYADRYPLGLGEPLDVGRAACFLLSDQARWSTGSILKLDGGVTLT